MRSYHNQAQNMNNDTKTETSYRHKHKHKNVVKPKFNNNTETETSYRHKHKNVVKPIFNNDMETETSYRHKHKHVVKRKFNNESDTDSYDSGSTLRRAREATRARCERQRMERRARKASLGGDRIKRRRTIPSKSNDHGNLDADEVFETVDETMRKNKKYFVSKTNRSTTRRLYKDSDSPGVERIDEFKFRKMPHSSVAGPPTNNYEDYEDGDIFMFHSTSNVGVPSTMERRYKGFNDDDTESDEPPFERIYRVDVARTKGSFTRKNDGSDAANSAHIMGSKMCGESVNENIIARQNEESSGIASGTQAKTMSAKKIAEVVQVSMDSSDEMSSSSTDDSEVKVVEDRIEIEISSDDEPNESKIQKIPSSKENKDKINKAPEESDENNIILADKTTSGEGLQANSNGEREGSSPKHVLNEQQEEKAFDKAVIEKRKVPSRKKQNGEKVRKRNDASEKNKTNTVHADEEPKERRIKKKSPTASCSDQSQLKRNPSEAEGMNRLAEDKDSQSNEANFVSDVNEEPVATIDIDCDYTENDVLKENGEGIVEEIPADDKIEKQVKKKLSSLRPIDLWQALADSVLGRGPLIESESDYESRLAHTNTPLPIKFRFEDEIPKKVEKTESEVEVADLFDEANLAFAMGQDSSKLPEANLERECSTAEETQEARCVRGLHELNQDDENGLYCICCHHVELGPRDILPQWERKTRRKPGKKRSYCADELPESVDERRVEPPEKNTVAFKCPDDGTVWDVIPGARNMYKHQQEGFGFLWKNLAGTTDIAELKNMAKPNEVGGCIISHAPGTGKTRLTIVFLESYLKVFPDSLPVIIAPASMLLTWEEEFETWGFPFPFHNLNNHEFTGHESKNALKRVMGPMRNNKDTVRMVKIFSWDKGGSVLGISYSLFEKLTGKKQVNGNKNKESMAESLKEILLEKPGLVILDEGHTARNETSNIWNALLKLKTDKRVILSGTPFQNNFGELFNMLRLVRPAVANVLAKDKTILKINTSRKRKHNQSGSMSEAIDGAELEKLKSIMLPFVNVHKGTILREKLTGLGDSVILLKPPELQKSLIETLEGHQSTFEFEHKVALTSVHPYLLKYCGSREKRNLGIDNNLVEASKLNPNEGAKTKFIVELLKLSMAANEKVLIFSQYIKPLKLIKDQLKEVFQWVDGKQILQMKGKLDQKHRQNLIKVYNEPLSEAKVMLASIKCCSEGISLVGASRVVLLDVVWNPSVERQAICRAYRIGQKKFVHTYHLMTSGTTEGDKYCRQVEKERLSELVFCSSYGESDQGKNQAAGCIKKDTILEQMVGSAKLKDMFEKIIYQPKETDFFQNFGLTTDFTEA